MISIPVSFLLAAVFLGAGIAMAFWRSLPGFARLLFAALFTLLALEAALVGARFAFGTFEFLAVQRTLPVWIAPALYLAFAALTVPPPACRRLILTNGLIALALSLAMLFPVGWTGYVDALITASYAAYTVFLIRMWSRGADRFSEAPTRLGSRLHGMLGIAILVMSATILLDLVIAVLFAQARDNAAGLVVSFASLIFLLIAVLLFILWMFRLQRSADGPKPTPEEQGEWLRITEAARHILIGQELHRDPGLTLTRLARRVGVPDRDLSRAVNRIEGVNVSQFVNRVRLEEAARLLTTTDHSVSAVQEKAGFLTRSNFYREFQKQFGVAPGEYRKSAQPFSARTSR